MRWRPFKYGRISVSASPRTDAAINEAYRMVNELVAECLSHSNLQSLIWKGIQNDWENDTYPRAECEFFDITAKSNGERYRIFVAATGLIDNNKQLPVVYVLDGNIRFGTVMETSRSLWLEAYIATVLVVGIWIHKRRFLRCLTETRYWLHRRRHYSFQ